jgi:methane monooxygenase PmoA-like
MMSVVRRRDGSVAGTWRDTELFRYVYRPREPGAESPRPYFHPVRTLRGDVVSLYRPHDHTWHKGIAWSLSDVGGMNFWGGPTYRRGRGYVQLANNGQMRHDSFDELDVDGRSASIGERLTWLTARGDRWISEHRRIGVTVHADQAAWLLSFSTSMRNISGEEIAIGSPTTQGRADAGYSGLFWRGPRSFSAGTLLTQDGPAGEELMGQRVPWLGYVGRHDGHGGASTLLFADNQANFCFPCQWFVRTGPYACVCPAPFFSSEYQLAAGHSLTLSFSVLIADGALDAGRCASLAEQGAAHDHRA